MLNKSPLEGMIRKNSGQAHFFDIKHDQQRRQSLCWALIWSLLLVIDLSDKSITGFLSGDIHAMALNSLERELYNNEDYEHIASNLRKYILNPCKQYKLPLNRIKWPDDKNQRNLLERQLLTEETFKKWPRTVPASLCWTAKAHNFSIAQKYSSTSSPSY